MKELTLPNALFTCVLLLSVWCEVSISENQLEEVSSNTGKHTGDTESIATANGQDQGRDVAVEEEETPKENDPPDKNPNSNNHLNDATHGDHDNPSDKQQSQTDPHDNKEVEGRDMDMSVDAVTPPPESDITHPPPQPVPTPQTSSETDTAKTQEKLSEPTDIASDNQDKTSAQISEPEEHKDVKPIDGSAKKVLDKSQSEIISDNQEDDKPQVAEDSPVTTEAKDPLLSESESGVDKDTNEQQIADGDKEAPVEVVKAETIDDGVDTDTPKDFKTEPPSGEIDQTAKSKEDDEVEEDINVPINANMMSFEDWKHHKSLSEQLDEKSKEENTQVKDASKSNKKRQNQASAQCGAKVVAWNPEADNPNNILSENRDLYMINPCKAKKWVVIELCEPVQIDQIELANFELFSSTPDMLNITISDRYPVKEWKKIGVVHAKDERAIQAFHFNRSSSRVFMMYAKFVKIEMLTYYSNEHFCPMSIVRVFGTAMSDDDFDDDAIAVTSDDTAVRKEPENNIIQQAFDKVTDIVNSFVKGSAENNGSANSNETGLKNVSGQQNSSVDGYMLPCVPVVESGDLTDVNNESITKGDPSQILPQPPTLGTESGDLKGEIPENTLIRKLEPHEQVSDISAPKTPHPYPPLYSNKPSSHTCDFCQVQSVSSDSCTIPRNCFLGFIQTAANKCMHQRFCEPPSIKQYNSADIKKTTQTYEPILIESVGIIEVIDEPVKEEEEEAGKENGAKVEGEVIKNTAIEDIPESSEVTGSKADIPAGTESSDSVIYIQPTATISASDKVITETIESSHMEETTTQQTTEHIQYTAIPKETTMPKGPEITESSQDPASNEKTNPEAGEASEQQEIEHTVGKIVQKVVDAIEVVDEGEDEGSQQEQQQQVDEPIQKKKESAMMRLHNKVKELERNMSISEQYLEQLSVRYIKQMEEIIKTFNKTITRLSNTSRAAEDRDMKQQMRIQVLESHVENITETMIGLSEQVKSTSQQLQDKHLLIVVLEVVVMVLLVVLCIMGGRRSSRELTHDQVEPVYTVVTPMKWRRRRHSVDGSVGHSPEKDKVENIGQTSEGRTVKASQPQNMLPFFFDDIKAGAAKKKRKRQRKSRSAAVLGELSTVNNWHPPEDIHSDVSSQCSTVSSQESGVHGVTDNRRHSAPLKNAANASDHMAKSLNNGRVCPSASLNTNVSHLDLTAGLGKSKHLKVTKKNSEKKFLNKKDDHIKNGAPVLNVVKQNGALTTNCSKSQHVNKSQNSVNHAQKETRTDTKLKENGSIKLKENGSIKLKENGSIKLKENGSAHILDQSERSGSYWFGWRK